MVSVRLLVTLVALGVVSAQEVSKYDQAMKFGVAIYEKTKNFLEHGMVHLYEDKEKSHHNWYGENSEEHGWHHGDDHHGHPGGHHGHWHKKMQHKMKEAMECHKKCGLDAACHETCPKPWAPFVKACQDFPAIQKCRQTCKAEACDMCPKFEVEWMNKKFAKNPEKAARIAEEKCPMMLKAHACHQKCTPGDFECHKKCHGMFHPHHDDDHHQHWHPHQDEDRNKHWHPHHDEDHHKPWHPHHDDDHHKHFHEEMRKKMHEAHECRKKCGTDAACGSQCPKPWAPIVKACMALPNIKVCHDTCKDAACDVCPKFDEEWINKKFAESPERFAHMAEEKCPMIEKAVACHSECKFGDHACHHKCPGMGFQHHGHKEEHKENHRKHWNKMHGHMKKAMMCHMKCGKDVQCHSKCPKPFAVFVKACQDFQEIQKCRATCTDAECEKCPKFQKEWMNKKLAKFPKFAMKMAEQKCPMVLEAHACHEACTPGDFECHHKCPKMFRGCKKKEEEKQKPHVAEEEKVDEEPIFV